MCIVEDRWIFAGVSHQIEEHLIAISFEPVICDAKHAFTRQAYFAGTVYEGMFEAEGQVFHTQFLNAGYECDIRLRELCFEPSFQL